MAHLFRPTYTAKDPQTGGTRRRQTRKWYGQYCDADGIRKRVPLSTDKDAAQAQLAEIIRTVERQKSGLIDRFEEQLASSVAEQVDEYYGYLEGQARAGKHISETIRHIRNAVKKCGWATLADLQNGEERMQRYLTSRRKSGVSHRTINADLVSIRSFWKVQSYCPRWDVVWMLARNGVFRA